MHPLLDARPINISNVKTLKRAWTFRTGSGRFAGSPMVVNGIMYFSAPMDLRDALFTAFNAKVPYLVEVRTRGDVPMPRSGYWDIADFLRLGNE